MEAARGEGTTKDTEGHAHWARGLKVDVRMDRITGDRSRKRVFQLLSMKDGGSLFGLLDF